MTDLSIRHIKERITDYRKYQRHPKLTALVIDSEYRLSLSAVDDFGMEISDTCVDIVDARGKVKTVKSLNAVFAFAERYSIDSNRVTVLRDAT